MSDELERRVRHTMTSSPVSVDAREMVTRVRRGARRRRRVRRVGAVLTLVLVAGSGAAVQQRLLTDQTSVSPVQLPSSTIPLISGPRGVAVTSTGVWVLVAEDESLMRIDPSTDRTEDVIDVAADSMSVVGEHLVLVDLDTRSATILDTRSERDTVIQGVDTFGNMAYDGSSLWMGSDVSGELTEVRLSDGHVLRRLHFPEVESYDSMAFAADGTLWTTTWNGELFHLDLERRRVLTRTEPFPDNTDYVAIAVVRDGVYAVSGGSDSLLRLDPQTGAIDYRRRVPISSASGFPAISVHQDAVWVVPNPRRVEQLDPSTGEPLTIYNPLVTGGSDPELLSFGGFAVGSGAAWLGLDSQVSDHHGLVRLTLR